MKVYIKESSSGMINSVDYSLAKKSCEKVSKRDYEKQRANIYLKAKKNIGLS